MHKATGGEERSDISRKQLFKRGDIPQKVNLQGDEKGFTLLHVFETGKVMERRSTGSSGSNLKQCKKGYMQVFM